MSGETHLAKLIVAMSPELSDEEYVFCTFENAHYGDHAALQPIATMHESEGLTLVVPRASAERAKLDYDAVFRHISLRVHSSLEAVGLTAAFSSKLAEHGLSANVVAGYYHDHIFIPAGDAVRAMAALGELSGA